MAFLKIVLLVKAHMRTWSSEPEPEPEPPEPVHFSRSRSRSRSRRTVLLGAGAGAGAEILPRSRSRSRSRPKMSRLRIPGHKCTYAGRWDDSWRIFTGLCLGYRLNWVIYKAKPRWRPWINFIWVRYKGSGASVLIGQSARANVWVWLLVWMWLSGAMPVAYGSLILAAILSANLQTHDVFVNSSVFTQSLYVSQVGCDRPEKRALCELLVFRR